MLLLAHSDEPRVGNRRAQLRPWLVGYLEDGCWHALPGMRVDCAYCGRVVVDDVFYLIDIAGACKFCFAILMGTPFTSEGRA